MLCCKKIYFFHWWLRKIDNYKTSSTRVRTIDNNCSVIETQRKWKNRCTKSHGWRVINRTGLHKKKEIDKAKMDCSHWIHICKSFFPSALHVVISKPSKSALSAGIIHIIRTVWVECPKLLCSLHNSMTLSNKNTKTPYLDDMQQVLFVSYNALSLFKTKDQFHYQMVRMDYA